MAKLTPRDVQRFLSGKVQEGKLKPISVGYLHRILRSALTQAVKWEMVRRNVATLVEPPRVVKINRQVLDVDLDKGVVTIQRELRRVPIRRHLAVRWCE